MNVRYRIHRPCAHRTPSGWHWTVGPRATAAWPEPQRIVSAHAADRRAVVATILVAVLLAAALVTGALLLGRGDGAHGKPAPAQATPSHGLVPAP